MKGRAGSAPPIRDVTDAEVERHFPLVHFVLERMKRRGQLATSVDYDDLVAAGRWGVWEALRRWDSSKGAQSTYLSSYVWGYVMKAQRDMTRADGWDSRKGEKIATVLSLDAALSDTSDESFTLLSTIAAPDDTVNDAEFSGRLTDLRRWCGSLREPWRTVAVRRLFEEATTAEIAADLGLSRARVGQMSQKITAALEDGPAPEHMRENVRGPVETWTQERVIAAIRRWHAEHDGPPRFSDWQWSGTYWPTTQTVLKRFGGWSNAIRAAGFEPARAGRPRPQSVAA